MPDYPRPDFQRPDLNWTSLDGAWDFLFDDADHGLTQGWHHQGLPAQTDTHPRGRIQVPYAFQTPALGIGLHEAHEVLWYERPLTDIRTAAEQARGHRLVLRFGAVDYECTVWVDGQRVGGHRGGHVPFDLDVSDAFRSEGPPATRRLTLRVRDSPYDLSQPRGKQYWGPVPDSIFYTPTSGIWQSVWLESLPRMRLGGSSEGTVLRSDDIAGGHLHARVAVLGRPAGTKPQVEVEARLGGVLVSRGRQHLVSDRDWASVDVDMRVSDPTPLQVRDAAWKGGVALWAPEHPVLYDLTLRLCDESGGLVDTVESTTGMRRISWTRGDGTFRLNGKPCFQTLVLDQGYWPETGLTPPSQAALRADIEMAQRMGLNGCRKHQKVEDPVFHYWADRLGFLVWGEIANGYAFGDDYIDRFNSEWTEAVRRDLNHPCIVAWTPFNESWGYPSLKDNVDQRNHIRAVYYLTKTLDPTRPINDNCGWEHVCTDLTTYHDYSDSIELASSCADLERGILGKKSDRDMFVGPVAQDAGSRHAPGAPVICSEFGGVNIVPAKGTAAGDRDWGYTTASDPEDLLARLDRLVMGIVQGGHTCGLVYTQLCDIEQEVNGLYSYDRKEKVPADRVKALMDAAHRFYHERVAPKEGAV
ncbi:glycoside hydrolase family 2 protein [Aspergillus heteromorphus CBS 117.55]|uniref:Glycoside hydrolase family 2 protein n=1 Tax=Aspergillus heteromorphus CBS 117.55 TaxID=1448321 RepID=A0A317VJ70_9EURO|nr:glycoside hydrolase family 2 protein [Aspergillus heteromorphus CBS 117.55]PWY73068.1 glycoside hydrolase family 2 protein [Aspergillus heteromorphus CBS 117.55]